MRRLFIDLDGVLADFDTSAKSILGMHPRSFEEEFGSNEFWSRLSGAHRFYNNLEPYPGAYDFMEALSEFDPWVLTGCPSNMPEAHYDKQEWVKSHFGKHIPTITTQSKYKSNFCSPSDVIVDDWPKHMEAWINKGGIWILHENFEKSLEEVRMAMGGFYD